MGTGKKGQTKLCMHDIDEFDRALDKLEFLTMALAAIGSSDVTLDSNEVNGAVVVAVDATATLREGYEKMVRIWQENR